MRRITALAAATVTTTLSTLLEPMVAVPVGRLPLLVGWIVLGLALLRWSQGGTGRSADSHPDDAT